MHASVSGGRCSWGSGWSSAQGLEGAHHVAGCARERLVSVRCENVCLHQRVALGIRNAEGCKLRVAQRAAARVQHAREQRMARAQLMLAQRRNRRLAQHCLPRLDSLEAAVGGLDAVQQRKARTRDV